ncbi:hypothetical protein BR93DRAFT_953632 [Coniochaeta sp. PMI_546]|nr:hypothetical protein BR93DRAFT_953632 [Coniochaeta sp. PMI_546]
MFQFKDTVAADAIAETNRRMLALKDTCIDPVTQKPYIRSLTGGRDNSIEGLQNGISYAFVVEFDSLEKRDYYVKVDPSHKAFLQVAGSVLEKAIVVDFTDGVF